MKYVFVVLGVLASIGIAPLFLSNDPGILCGKHRISRVLNGGSRSAEEIARATAADRYCQIYFARKESQQ